MRGGDADEIWLSKALAGPREAGAKAIREGDYRLAVREFDAGAERATEAGDWVSRGRFLANQSGAHIMLWENREAIRCLLLAREAAGKSGDLSTLQTVDANLATVYVQTGDYEAAAAAADRGGRVRPPRQKPEQRVRTLMIFGKAIAKARGVAAATAMWSEALETADSASLEADVLELWGYELAERNEDRAEEFLRQAWYKRKLSKDARIPLTEGKLARLARKKGEIAAARFWIDRIIGALEGGRKIPVSEWILRAEEAHISSEEGRLEAGLRGYRRALRLAERWRENLPRQDRLRLGAEQRMMRELFDGYLRTAGRQYRKAPKAALAAEMFTTIQNSRAWSMEETEKGVAADGPLYAKARRLEGRWLAGEAAAGARLKILRAAILEKEAGQAAGAERPPARLEEPGEGEAVLTYWLHAEGSWLWVWTKRGLRMASLPGREQVLGEAESFRTAIAGNAANARAKGERLMTTLLGGLRAECLRAKRWEIVADEGLFQVPFAALPVGDTAYLTERVELRLIPNALRRPAGPRGARRFLAVADPIFNTADERRERAWFWQRTVHAGDFALELPRLPGTRREAEAARAAWKKAGYETAVQLGAESGEETVLERLREWQPGIVHIATHTISTAAGGEARPRLALSLRPDGSAGLLAAEDIAALGLRVELAVLSACHSTGGETARGSGLLGLTRAWLTAGSRQVIATLWPVGDEPAAFYPAFYERLAGGEAGSPLLAAPALRQAQLACLRGGGRSAEPRFWAGHVLLARR